MNNHSKHIEWQKAIVNIPHVTFVSMEKKEMNISSQKTKTKIQKANEKMLSLFKKPETKEEGERSFRI